MAIKNWKTTSVGENVYKLEPLCTVGSCCERVWWFLKKLNIELPYDPIVPLLHICIPMSTKA